MALLSKTGNGQVEFNVVSSQTTKEIISTMPVANTITSVEMGSFLAPDYTNGVMVLPDAGAAAYIINNEVKNYKPFTSRKDFKLEYANASVHNTAQNIYPRGYKMHVGDKLHLNLIDGYTNVTAAGATFILGSNGYLVAETNASNLSAASMVFTVEKRSSMPDGQSAPKLVCTKANY